MARPRINESDAWNSSILATSTIHYARRYQVCLGAPSPMTVGQVSERIPRHGWLRPPSPPSASRPTWSTARTGSTTRADRARPQARPGDPACNDAARGDTDCGIVVRRVRAGPRRSRCAAQSGDHRPARSGDASGGRKQYVEPLDRARTGSVAGCAANCSTDRESCRDPGWDGQGEAESEVPERAVTAGAPLRVSAALAARASCSLRRRHPTRAPRTATRSPRGAPATPASRGRRRRGHCAGTPW